MSSVLRDSVWQFIGAALTFIAIFVSIVRSWTQRRRKSLSYELLSSVSILSMATELEGRLQLLFQGEQIHKAYLLVIRLSNTGNTPILSSDYERPVCFKFGDNTRILAAEVSETNPGNIEASVIADEQGIKLQPLLLHSGDSIAFKALVSQFDGEVDIDGRIVGVKKITKRERKFVRGVPIILVVVAVSLLVLLSHLALMLQPILLLRALIASVTVTIVYYAMLMCATLARNEG